MTVEIVCRCVLQKIIVSVCVALIHQSESALHVAVQNNHKEVAELLLNSNASIDGKNKVHIHTYIHAI